MNKFEKAIIKASKDAEISARATGVKTKYMKNNNGDYVYCRPMLAGAYIKDNKTKITNAYWFVLLNKDYSYLEDIKKVDFNIGDFPQLEKLLPNEDDYKEVNVDIEKVRELAKSKEIEKYRVGDKAIYNAEFLITVYNCLEDCKMYLPDMEYTKETANKFPLYFKGTNGVGILLPIWENRE